MPRAQPTAAREAFSLLGDNVSIAEAVSATGITARTILQHIRDGNLEAFVPGGGDPRGVGYRIKKDVLQAWFFNDPRLLGIGS